MAEQKIIFIKGAEKRGITQANRRENFEQIEGLSALWICSRLIGLVMLLWHIKTAYLKVYYPVESWPL